MLKNIDHHATRLRRGFLIKACLFVIFTAVPASSMPDTPINLTLNASFNGYTAKSGAKGIWVTCVGVHMGTSETSGILIGLYRVTVTLNNQQKITRTLNFTNGSAVFGIVDARVVAVSVVGPARAIP